jgi:hypothetical protein
LFTIFVPRKPDYPVAKPEHPILVFELLSRFFINLLIGVLQVLVVPCVNLLSVWKNS